MEGVSNATVDGNSTFPMIDLDSVDSFTGDEESPVLNVMFLVLLVVGIFANVLVMSVQASRLTTSTRVYTFSLASVDAVVCIGLVGAVIARPWLVIQQCFIYIAIIAIAFSLFLLAFVATERCVAVLRPHTFNLSTRRAINAVTIMVIGSTICATALMAARTLLLNTMLLSLRITILTSTSSVITGSYIMVAATLWKRSRDKAKRMTRPERTAHGSARVAPDMQLSTVSAQLRESSCAGEMIKSSNFASLVSNGPRRRSWVNELGKIKEIAKRKTPGTLLLVFVMTAVYYICWLPFWLHASGVPMNIQFSRLCLLHPVLNPIVYGFLSPMFRDDVRQSFRQTRTRLSRCCGGR